ncbi:hypothetical protein C8Q80DRAFT_1272234 [Daedaleopsis nitida]|nr:hypothetical protein C8Q80DRAFT_1272234 [Daedaleopsis nitida]
MLPAPDAVSEVERSTPRHLQLTPLVGAATADLAKFAVIVDALLSNIYLPNTATVLSDFAGTRVQTGWRELLRARTAPHTNSQQGQLNDPWWIVQANLDAIRMRRNWGSACTLEEKSDSSVLSEPDSDSDSDTNGDEVKINIDTLSYRLYEHGPYVTGPPITSFKAADFRAQSNVLFLTVLASRRIASGLG